MGYSDKHGPLLQLIFNNDRKQPYNLGTAYGHIALTAPDLYNQCSKIKDDGGNVTREPGPVKGGTTEIAFIEAPEGYKYELIKRDETWKCPILHLMLRVGNIEKTRKFYETIGMTMLRDSVNDQYKYTLYFMGFGPEEHNTVLEFTYNWGVEKYEHGDAYLHITVTTPDIVGVHDKLRSGGYTITKDLDTNNSSFTCVDPDGYSVHVVTEQLLNLLLTQ